MPATRKSIIFYVILGIIFILFFSIPVIKIYNVNELYAIDPWHHMYFTRFVEPVDYYGNSLQVADGEYSTHYPSFMRSLLYLFHLVTGVDYFQIFKYFGFITRIILSLIILIIVRLLINKKALPSIGILLLFSGSYFWYRSYITFTENFILIFQAIILYLSIFFLKKGNNISLLLLAYFVAISFYFHPPSSIIGIILYFSTIISYAYEKKEHYQKYKYHIIYFSVLVFLFIGAFSLKTIAIEYMNQIIYNVGNSEGYGDLKRFIAPTIQDYLGYQSAYIIIFTIFCIVFLFQKKIYTKTYIYPLIITFLFTFILSNGVRFNLNLPTDRMQGFLLTYISILGIYGLFFLCLKKNIFFKLLLFAIIILYSIINTFSVNSWTPLKSNEKELQVFLENELEKDINKMFCFEKVSFEIISFNSPQRILLNCNNASSGDLIITIDNKDSKLIFKNKSYNVYEVE